MENILYFFIIILIIKFVINFSRYWRCKNYLAKYEEYFKNPDWKFVQNSVQIVELLKNAGIEDSVVTAVEPIGFGKIQSSHPSVFDNLTTIREDVVGLVLLKFHKAIGVYRSRMLETINPIYWVELAIFLPKHILSYLGVSPESTLIKIIQVVYWLVATIVGFIIGLFRTEIETLIKTWLTSFTP